jgi:Flp pilus assembly pilin Flp
VTSVAQGRADRGATLVETALLVALVAVAALGAVTTLGARSSTAMEKPSCALGARHAEACNRVRNGNFDRFDQQGRTLTTFGTGAVTGLPGWSVASGTIDIHGSHNAAADGGNSVDLNGSGRGSLMTSVDASGGEEMVLTFDVAENTTCGPDVKQMTISYNGQFVSTQQVNTIRPMSDPGWQRRSVTLPASASGEGQLIFASGNDSNCGVMIDNVNVQPRPPRSDLMVTARWHVTTRSQ